MIPKLDRTFLSAKTGLEAVKTKRVELLRENVEEQQLIIRRIRELNGIKNDLLA